MPGGILDTSLLDQFNRDFLAPSLCMDSELDFAKFAFSKGMEELIVSEEELWTARIGVLGCMEGDTDVLRGIRRGGCRRDRNDLV